MKQDGFIHIPFTAGNLDRYQVRVSILHALNEALPLFKGRLLDVGCGRMPYRQYILDNAKVSSYTGMDLHNALVYDTRVKPDILWDGKRIPIPDGSFDSAMATEVLEHVPDPTATLREVHRVLVPGGTFFFTVPFLWNLHEVPHDEYRYTPFSLQRHLAEAGFRKITLQAMGGWHASLAQMLGLWVRRAPMSPFKRSMLSWLLKPLARFLLSKDRKPAPPFREGQMITGLYGWATA
jgi:SAM-dependent methyltransferase